MGEQRDSFLLPFPADCTRRFPDDLPGVQPVFLLQKPDRPDLPKTILYADHFNWYRTMLRKHARHSRAQPNRAVMIFRRYNASGFRSRLEQQLYVERFPGKHVDHTRRYPLF